MRVLKSLSGMFFAITAMAMFGCGGGGGGGTSQPTTATLKLLSAGPTAMQVSGIEVTVVLPAGVTVKTKTPPTTPLETAAGVVVLSGATVAKPGLLVGIHTPASATAPGTVSVRLTSAGNTTFDLGEYVTVNTDILTGNFPTAGGFILTGFKAFNLDGAEIPGVSSIIVAEIR